MDYRELAKIHENKEMTIKHMAFAVRKVDHSLKEWKGLLSVSSKIEPVIWEKAKTRVENDFTWDASGLTWVAV